MNMLIVYDSTYGNTEQLAKTLARAAKRHNHVSLMHVRDAEIEDVVRADALIVGSPTQGGRPTAAIQQFIDDIAPGALHGKLVTAFDTRFAIRDHGLGLRLLMRTIGFAASKIARDLQSRGGKLAAEPTGFIVHDKRGPLEREELQHARYWINTLDQPTHLTA